MLKKTSTSCYFQNGNSSEITDNICFPIIFSRRKAINCWIKYAKGMGLRKPKHHGNN